MCPIKYGGHWKAPIQNVRLEMFNSCYFANFRNGALTDFPEFTAIIYWTHAPSCALLMVP